MKREEGSQSKVGFFVARAVGERLEDRECPAVKIYYILSD
jgi:hypothetical protein